ncbi:hypothetical protein RJ639_040886 [Escallonia herrerae]|uniref:Sorting nexin C-terminal domain-containing protein n=1 Tax=Escallonia herrerae TaxID=1293975 RepID=A0AA88WHW4_9ASTE|nr:hypothetical protein RJ639_040886 [Escallonia herrerae]
MGDALDDWLIEKIQLLRRGSVVASGINRVEQILWPDGYFITKHPKRQRPRSSVSPYNSPHGQPPTPLSSANDDSIWKLEELQQKEAQRRAKFVYELMIDNAPAAIVGLVGRKEYEQCAKDLYYFLQSSVCLKQLAFDLLELLLLSAFPELDYVFREVHDQKENALEDHKKRAAGGGAAKTIPYLLRVLCKPTTKEIHLMINIQLNPCDL